MPSRKTASNTQHEEAARHPWIQLLDLEQQQLKPAIPRKKGHPFRKFPRIKRMLLTMTDAEKEAVDDLVELLKKNIGPGVVRADLVAFLAFRLIDDLNALGQNEEGQLTIPDHVRTFTDLANYLDAKLAPQKENSPKEAKKKKSTPSEPTE